jgi:lipopolysaccharide heptosyltransferase I
MAFERILIIRPSALGDVCRSVPVLVSLRRALPEARIDWLVQSEFIDAIRAHPDLSNAVPFARRDLSLGRLHTGQARRKLRELIRSLREPGYDLVLDCQGLARSGLLARLTGARTRVGHADARELAWLLYNTRVRPSGATHTVDRMLDLVRAIDVPVVDDMRLYAPPDRHDEIPDNLRDAAPLVIAPTSRWPGKRWPIERFAEVTRWVLDRTAHTIAIVGASSERDQCAPLTDEFAGHARVTDLIGTTSIGGLMHLISASSAVLANDSAALHMAVGYNKPVVALFGPTDTRKVGPYQRDDSVVQHVSDLRGISHKHQDAGLELMRRITVDEVVERLQPVLESPTPTGSAVP